MSKKILIVEDEFVIAYDLRRIVTELGYVVMGFAKSADEALDKIKEELPDLLLLDIQILGERNGIELAEIVDKQYKIPYIYVTSYSDIETLKKMNKTNPLGYVLKPFDERDVRVALEIGLSKDINPEQKVTKKSSVSKVKSSEYTIVGDSPELQKTLKKVERVAYTDVTILINGETGTGKELIMREIHRQSPRKDKILVNVNCAALPAELIESVLFGHEKGSFTGATEKRIGKFEQAEGGTIFLDEIGELPLISQSKLLRCLQEKEIETVGGSALKKVDVRIIAATNKNLEEEVSKGTFRADLFFRLNIFPIQVPPLRKRRDDIELLANHFLEKFASHIGQPTPRFTTASMNNLKDYHWPGNIRELKHYTERGVLLAEGDTIEISFTKDESRVLNPSNKEEFQLKSLEDVEREQIIQTLKYCNGKIRGKGGAAEILKLHPNTLDFRVKKLGIQKEQGYK